MRAASALSAAKGKTTSRARLPCPGMRTIEAATFDAATMKMIVLGKLLEKWSVPQYLKDLTKFMSGGTTPVQY